MALSSTADGAESRLILIKFFKEEYKARSKVRGRDLIKSNDFVFPNFAFQSFIKFFFFFCSTNLFASLAGKEKAKNNF